jgi:Zn-dependent protease
MLNNSPSELISAIITLLVAFSFHEFSHAWTATRFGDDTPRLFGRLTLNPLSHLDLIGSLMLIFTGFGWAKPVPINPQKIRRHSPSALMLVAASGPLSNFLLALIAAVPLRLGWLSYSMTPVASFMPTPLEFTIYFFYTNLGLMVFNLLPLPPLDGEEILMFFLPPAWQMKWETIRPYGPYLLLFLLFIGPMIGFNLIESVLQPLIVGMARLLLGGFVW